jgi:hypothetical protein
MAGQDPRPGNSSELWDLVASSQTKERPSAATWARIVEIVLGDDRYRRDFVDSTASIKAAEKLMDFLFAKRKAVEVTGHLTASVAVTQPLTVEEIEKFEERFCDEF